MSISNNFNYLAASLNHMATGDPSVEKTIRDYSAEHPKNSKAARYVRERLPKLDE